MTNDIYGRMSAPESLAARAEIIAAIVGSVIGAFVAAHYLMAWL